MRIGLLSGWRGFRRVLVDTYSSSGLDNRERPLWARGPQARIRVAQSIGDRRRLGRFPRRRSEAPSPQGLAVPNCSLMVESSRMSSLGLGRNRRYVPQALHLVQQDVHAVDGWSQVGFPTLGTEGPTTGFGCCLDQFVQGLVQAALVVHLPLPSTGACSTTRA